MGDMNRCTVCRARLEGRPNPVKYEAPHGVMTATVAEDLDPVRIDGPDLSNSSFLVARAFGCFVRAILEIHLDGGHVIAYDVWVRVAPEDYERLGDRWRLPQAAGLVMYGELANEPANFAVLGAPVKLEVVDPHEPPHIVASNNETVQELLYGEWPHDRFWVKRETEPVEVSNRKVSLGLLWVFLAIGGGLGVYGGFRLFVGVWKDDVLWITLGSVMLGLGVLILLFAGLVVLIFTQEARQLSKASSGIVSLRDERFQDLGKVVLEIGPINKVWDIAGGTSVDGWSLTPHGLATVVLALLRDHGIEPPVVAPVSTSHTVLHFEDSDPAIATAKVVQNLFRDGFGVEHAVARARYYGFVS